MKIDSNEQADDLTLVFNETEADDASLRDGMPEAAADEAEDGEALSFELPIDDIPDATLDEASGESVDEGQRSGWRIFSAEDLPQVSLNRYASQQEILEEEEMRKELVEKKNYALTQYAELTMRTRQSSLERILKNFGDSTLLSAKEAPFIIYKKR